MRQCVLKTNQGFSVMMSLHILCGETETAAIRLRAPSHLSPIFASLVKENDFLA